MFVVWLTALSKDTYDEILRQIFPLRGFVNAIYLESLQHAKFFFFGETEIPLTLVGRPFGESAYYVDERQFFHSNDPALYRTVTRGSPYQKTVPS